MEKFKLVQSKRKEWIKYSYLINIGLILLTCLYVFTNYNYRQILEWWLQNQFNFVAPFAIPSIVFIILYNLDIKEVKEIGYLEIHMDKFVLSNKNRVVKYSLEQLNDLNVKLVGYSGQQVTGGGAPKGGIGADFYNQVEGHENMFKFTNNQGGKFSYNFYLKNKQELEIAKGMLRYWDSQIKMRLDILR